MAALLVLLGLALSSALLVRYLPVPYTVLLVLEGLALGAARVNLGITLSRDLILHLFLPLLLFEAALQVDLRLLRDALPAMFLLAGPGVVLSTALIGWGLYATTGLSLSAALLFGAIVSATDPVAVLATFKRLALPGRLALLIEGESVLNDGTALVLFTLLLPAAQGREVDGLLAALQFFGVVAGGIAVGGLCGAAGAFAARFYDDHLAELTLTVLVAYGSYLLAERLGLSGVIACVCAGLAFTTRSEATLSAPARELLADVWEFAAFFANSLLFVLIGLSVAARDYQAIWSELAWAVLFTVLARVVVVYGCGALLRLSGRPLVWRHGFIVFWSGLRGALALALALSLPDNVQYAILLRQLTAGVVLFTLLVQGSTVDLLLRRRFGRDSGQGVQS